MASSLEHSTDSTTTTTSPYLNNASIALPVSIDLKANSCDFQLVEVARILCPSLLGSSNWEDLTAKPLSGGLSNVLYVVTSHTTKHQVLVRIQSNNDDHQQEDALVNVEEENHVMAWLSQQGKAPTYYGRFGNGRVEEFYSGYIPLSSAEMVLHQTQIACLLASIHTCVPPETVLPRNNNNNNNRTGGQCWSTIQKWLEIYKSLQQQQEEESKDESLELDYLQRELVWLKGQLTTTTTSSSSTTEDTSNNNNNNNNNKKKNAAIQYCRQVVFCHMDAQSLNLLRNENENDIKLIDYEYAAWNPRAADIANTWCEYCDMNTLNANYQEQYPSNQAQEEFLHEYLKSMGDCFEKQDYPTMVWEINRHACISHLLWTVWSLVQSKQSDIDFDYVTYAKQRMEGYHYFKQQYFFIK